MNSLKEQMPASDIAVISSSTGSLACVIAMWKP
jgi:hypothetical protein